MIKLSQSIYINKVLDRFNIKDCKRGFLPMSHGMSLSKTFCPFGPNKQKKLSMGRICNMTHNVYDMYSARRIVCFEHDK